jgi:hypothetical protein
MVELMRVEQVLRAKQSESLMAFMSTLKKGEGYAVGLEILKIVFSPQQKCFTEDQYFILKILADTFNAASDHKADPLVFMELIKKRAGCKEVAPISSASKEGYVVLGVPSNSGGRILEFTNFDVAGVLERNADPRRMNLKQVVLKPKFDMNIRANTQDIELGGNSPIGIIKSDQCAAMTEFIPSLRGNSWGRISIRDC